MLSDSEFRTLLKRFINSKSDHGHRLSQGLLITFNSDSECIAAETCVLIDGCNISKTRQKHQDDFSRLRKS